MSNGDWAKHKEIIVAALLAYMGQRAAAANRCLIGKYSQADDQAAAEYRDAAETLKFVEGLKNDPRQGVML